MSNIVDDDLVRRIGARIRLERERRGWTLAELAQTSGVSKAMINRVERGESSPTAVLLGKLSGAFELSISSLLALAEGADDRERAGAEQSDAGRAGVERAGEAVRWRDPATGYTRRPIARPGFPVEVAEVHLPPAARVPYPAAAFAFVHQLIWVLDGRLTFHEGALVHELDAGDTLELGAPADCVFANNTDADCHYTVVLTRRSRP